MRRIVIWVMSTLTVVVLLFSYNTSRSSTLVTTAETRQVASSGSVGSSSGSVSGSSDQAAAATGSDSGSGSSSGTGSTSSGSGSDSGSTGASGQSTGSQTFAGDAVMTRYGAVQVQITVSGGKITAADVLQVPWQDRHDQMINSQAVPVYNSEAVQAQSADIDVVSGATVTWEGYTQSLQSAIDAAHI